MKIRWKILIALAAFLGIFTGIWLLTMHVQPANEVDAYKQVLRERGEKLEISELIPPPVPAAENAAGAVQQAFQMIGTAGVEVPSAMKMVAPGKAMTAWGLPQARGYDFTNSWDDFNAEEEADQQVLALLGQVLVQPRLDFHLDYQKGYHMSLSNWIGMKLGAQKLTAAAIGDLHNGDSGSATTNLCVLLGLVQVDADERREISQLVRYADAAFAETATWDYLQYTNLKDAQLALVQKSWEQQEYIRPMETAFGMERAILCQTIEQLRASPADFAGFFGVSPGGFMDKAKLAAGEFMWRTSWNYSDEIYALHSEQIMLETLRAMETNVVLKPDYDAMASQLSSLGATNTKAVFFRALDIPDFSEIVESTGSESAIRKMMQAETWRRVVVTAIALRRYDLKHGRYPDGLSDLTPGFISTVPIDPYDGLPLKYRLNTDGTFVLYSVGEDGVDNGGDASVAPGTSSGSLAWRNLHARDWVWPQAATAAEVEKYDADEAAKGK